MFALRELGLQIEAAQSGKADVEHQAARHLGQLAFQQFGGRTERLDLDAYRLNEISERPAHR